MIPDDDLIARHLHGLSSDEERAELDRRIAASPETANAFARASRLDQALGRHFHEAEAVSRVQVQIRRLRLRRRLIGAAAAAVVLLGFLLTRSHFETREVLAYRAEGPLYAGAIVSGPTVLQFPGELTTIRLSAGAVYTVEASDPGKRGRLERGQLEASVAKQAHPMILSTPTSRVEVVGTAFTLSARPKETRLEVTEGRVHLLHGGAMVAVRSGQFVEAKEGARPPMAASLYEDRFEALWRELHDPKNGYFSADGIPYHSAETFIIDAPDYGHLTTSETVSYWLWLEAMHGRSTGDWSGFTRAWHKMEDVLIPAAADQPNTDAYDPRKPATYVPEADRIADYPVRMDPSVPVGRDPLYAELRATHVGTDLYLMHWLLDVDDFYGYGRRAFVNTFQRGPMESVWSTLPHPSRETFSAGGRNGFLDLFLKEPSYAKQWRYTGAPDADARVLQAVYWASRWAKEQGFDPAAVLPLRKAGRMADSLRYALHDKYFRTEHDLIAWSAAWGGSLDAGSAWSWRSGSSHVHFGYQNPVAAWALATQALPAPSGSAAARDWSRSMARQVEFYRWLQSAEGAISGGATSSLHGRYETPAPGTPMFHGLAYVDHPVFRDPPSNEWFGWQAWSMGRLAQYARLADDPVARGIVDRWAAWARSVVKLTPDGGYAIPSTLKWSGRPDPWDPAAPGRNAALHVTVVDETQDVGVAAALARALIAEGGEDSRATARELLDRMWRLYRDERGVSNPEARADYKRLNEPATLPPDWRGALASGDVLRPGATFLDLRPKLRQDPEFRRVDQELRNGRAPVFRYHRFWAQVEIALANAEYARLWK